MPLYEYQCASCRKIHEVMQKFSDAPLTECPDCKGALTKLMSMSSFALKGSGWYTTDYKRKSAGGGGSSPDAGGSSSPSSGSGESAKPSDASPAKTDAAGASPKGDGAGTGAKNGS